MAWRKHSSHSAPATVLDAKDGQVPEQGEPDEEDPYAELPMTSWRTFDSFEGDHVQDLPVEAEEEEEEEDDGELGPLMDKVETFDPFEDDTHAVDAGRAAGVPLAGTPPLPAASLPEPTILPMAPAVPSQDFPRVMCVPAYPVQVMCPPVAGITGTTPSTTPNCSPRPEPPVLLGRTAQAESAAPLECLRLPNGKEMVRWKVDARKLDSQEKQILSPEFELQLPGLGLKPFRIMILAKETKGKGGRGFVKAGGKGRLFVKCETSSLAQARAMAFRVSVGPATVESKGRAGVRTGFATKTERAAAYPKLLCDAIAKLVVDVFKKSLALEFWRYQLRMKAAEVSSLQQKWLIEINEERKLRGLSIADTKREKRDLERSLETMWNEQGLPRSAAKISKKELRETENDMSVGGMRNPDLAVERLTLVRETGAKLRAEWEKIYAEEPDFAEGASAGRKGFWLHSEVASKDPDLCLQQFIREGVPLGMSSKIPPSGGVFPPARNQEIQCVEAQVEFEECQNMVNYSSVQEHPREAEEEISRYKAKGFVRRMPWAEARDAYSIGTVSKLALILKPKADGSALVWVAMLFGFKAAPLLMGRLSAALGRLLQSMVQPNELVMQIYIDDLLIAMRGRPEERCKLLSMFLYTMRALGIMISLEKGRGTRVTWIGTQFVFETRKPENGRRITVGLPFKMCKEVYDTLVEWTGKAALNWLIAMLDTNGFKLQARIMWLKEKPAEWGIISDASPMGLGAILWKKDAETGRIQIIEAYEAYAILRAVKLWQRRIQCKGLILKSDSSVALGIAKKLSSPSPSLNYIAAELVRQIEIYHIPRTFNKEADWLSRPHERGDMPETLQGIRLKKLKGQVLERSSGFCTIHGPACLSAPGNVWESP
ncbi:Tyr recombinase domain-containing protein [Durusdinium trenchii]|uniref:Tyr recombinase domain-containing protein n=2 Tax=Durusdinium trenchii TaxID=1381693 RepID=A0ABP0I1E9_9DINO